jgi:hypothetical protein
LFLLFRIFLLANWFFLFWFFFQFRIRSFILRNNKAIIYIIRTIWINSSIFSKVVCSLTLWSNWAIIRLMLSRFRYNLFRFSCKSITWFSSFNFRSCLFFFRFNIYKITTSIISSIIFYQVFSSKFLVKSSKTCIKCTIVKNISV